MSVFFNEFHYDNVGTDEGEFIEIAGPAGTELTGWSVLLYNGSNGSIYNTLPLTGTLDNDNNGFGFKLLNLPSNGLQNGSPDGFALVDATNTVVEFLSYEGAFTALEGAANSLTSTDIGVEETSITPIGNSLQRTGTGTEATDFIFIAPFAETPGAANTGQTFTGGTSPNNVFISEIHYDNDGSDTGEFIEVTGDAGVDLTDYSLVLYNGNGGSPYNTVNLTGAFTNEFNGLGAIAFSISGIQNGSPDGVALVAPDNSVVEFLSYEGSFVALGGPADGLTSTDIGISEPANTPLGESLQLIDGAWIGPAANSEGDVNNAPALSANAFISEIHYDNDGVDVGEFVEVTADANADLSGYSLLLYNGNNGEVYSSIALSGIVPDESNGQGAIAFDIVGLQNGSPDGIVLVDPNGDVVEFLSYEGTFVAVGGAADGLTSTDIGVEESANTLAGQSLQLLNGSWTGPAAETKGVVNSIFVEAFISEIHYDNEGTDVGEFIEISANAGADLSGYSLALYNGNGGTVYNTVSLSGIVPDEVDGLGALSFSIPGLQNGSPDGVALVDPDGNVVEFLSYEGPLTATDGPAVGLISTDIGVAETSSTPVGQSLQLINDSWTGPSANSAGLVNADSGPAESKLIHEVQGTDAASPLVGQNVIIEAVVTGDFQNGDANTLRNLEGFYVQEEDTDTDGDSQTSEGLFIFEDGDFLTDVNVGDLVQVIGTVEEAFGQTQLTVTSQSDITVVSSGNPLPTAATVNFPVTTVDDLEAFEGMQVSIPDTLFVTEYFNLDRFGEVVLSSDGASNAPGTDGRLDQYTQFNDPDVAAFSAYQEEIAKRRIVLDDGQTAQNPDTIIHGRGGNPLSNTNTLRGGDTVSDLSGILGFGFGDYRIQPTAPVNFQATNPRPNNPEDVGGDLKVVSFNVLNFFTTLDAPGNPGSGPNGLSPRGADDLTQFGVTPATAEFDRQIEKLVTTLEIINADIVGLIELENEFGGDQNGDGQFAIDVLVDALNAKVGAGTYAFADPGTTFVDTGDAISVGAIYKTSTVKIADGTTVEVLTDSDLPALGLGGTPVFDGVSTNRAPLAVTFEEIATGEELTVAVNHFKSKGGTGSGDDADIGDGQGNFNGTRLRGAEALDAWLDSRPTGTTDDDVLIIGDLNAYAQEEPITFLETEGYTNVVENPESAYSFVFDGQFGTLDYGLANSTLMPQLTGATEWNVNADEPDALDYNLDFGRDPSLFDGMTSFRNSDHDPLIIGLDLTGDTGNPPTEINGTKHRDRLTGTDGNDIIRGFRGRDRINGGNGNDTIIGGSGFDILTGGSDNDTFAFEELSDRRDRIRDFVIGEDLLDFSAVLDLDRYGSETPFDDYFRIVQGNHGRTFVQLDLNGDFGYRDRFRTIATLNNVSAMELTVDSFLL